MCGEPRDASKNLSLDRLASRTLTHRLNTEGRHAHHTNFDFDHLTPRRRYAARFGAALPASWGVRLDVRRDASKTS
jgi:hypothetical protein